MAHLKPMGSQQTIQYRGTSDTCIEFDIALGKPENSTSELVIEWDVDPEDPSNPANHEQAESVKLDGTSEILNFYVC